MNGAEVFQLASSLGLPGALIMYMIWDRLEMQKIAEKRLAADLKVAETLALLAERIRK